MKKENIILAQSNSKPIVLDVTFKENKVKKPIVIFCHGYKGFKDWGCWNLLAEDVAKENNFFLKFNFSHNGGTINNPIDFSDLNAFGKNNFCKELDDLKIVIDYLMEADNMFSDEIDYSNITLIGHSRGGGIVTIKASEDSRITKLITLAGVSDFKNRFPVGSALLDWEKNGVAYIYNARTKQQMPHFIQFYNNFIENEARLTISNAVQQLDVPYLIIHGTNDETVKITEGKCIHQWNSKSQFITINDANHVFGGSHPWLEGRLPNHMIEVSSLIKKFIQS